MLSISLPVVKRIIKPIRLHRHSLYIEPTSVCNLKCLMCYTNVINGSNRKVLSSKVVYDFVERFSPKDIYWCGTGEVFLWPELPAAVNKFAEMGIEQTIQTNGTLPARLREFTSFSKVTFRVSIDGEKNYHDSQRGEGTYEKSIRFCQELVSRGCETLEIRCLISKGNIETLTEFDDDIKTRISPQISPSLFTMFTEKDLASARSESPLINQNSINDEHALSVSEAKEKLESLYNDRFILVDCDPDTAVDNYLSINPYGVYTCCNGMVKIGEAEDSLDLLMQKMIDSKEQCELCSLHPCQ